MVPVEPVLNPSLTAALRNVITNRLITTGNNAREASLGDIQTVDSQPLCLWLLGQAD